MESGSMSMSHDMRDKSLFPSDVKVGVGVDMIAPMPVDRTGDKPLGLEDVPHRVLTYHDLAPLTPFHDKREPTRSVDIHLTGNMERFMWSFDGRKWNEGAEPIRFARNERVRRSEERGGGKEGVRTGRLWGRRRNKKKK